MIDRDGKVIVVRCDNCSNEFSESHIFDFSEAMRAAKEEGFINRQVDGEWKNFCCKECFEEYKSGH